MELRQVLYVLLCADSVKSLPRAPGWGVGWVEGEAVFPRLVVVLVVVVQSVLPAVGPNTPLGRPFLGPFVRP